jgi:glycosyltransferase involved in cell wall biosynthesis
VSSPAKPEVSVFIQTYQHADYIRDAVDNVLAQRAPFDFELAIADDCSTDGTREILHEYRARHPDRIRLLLPERNLGPTELFRRGVGELRGRYVAWLDGDDFWSDEGKLARQVAALDEHPGWPACFHDATVVDLGGGAPDRPYVPVIERGAVTLGDLVRQNVVPSLSVMARGDLVRGLPGWVWSHLWSDWLALVSFALHGEIGYLPGSMGVYRLHRGGLCGGLSRQDQLEEDLRFFEVLRGVLGPGHQTPIEASVRERHCQLVVERAGVPFSGAVAVLGPEQETPTYLNGRNVFQLSVGEDPDTRERRDRDGGLGAQLEHHRRQAEREEPGLAHFAVADHAPAGPRKPSLHLLAVGPLAEWLERESRLGGQLEGVSTVVARDDACTLLEVHSAVGAPAPMGALAEVVDVSSAAEPSGLFRAYVDAPTAGSAADAHAVEFAGWAIGGDSPVVAVEMAIGGRPFRRVPVGVARPDLERAFPGRPEAGRAGFAATISLVALRDETRIELLAILEDQRRRPFGAVDVRRSWRKTLEGPAPLVSVVVPALGRPHHLREAIGSVLAQTYANLDVVVVGSGSLGAHRRLVDLYPGVRRADTSAGLREGAGELVVFLDSEERPAPRAIERRVAEPRAAGTGQSRRAT